MLNFDSCIEEILQAIKFYHRMLANLSDEDLTRQPQKGSWCIKEILGHLIDSASNNIHRIVHLQYQPIPLRFPNYGSDGNNSNWIRIQNYMAEDWRDMVELWKYTNLHLIHVIENLDTQKLDNVWIAGQGREITLRVMIEDYPKHMKQHLVRIEETMNYGLNKTHG